MNELLTSNPNDYATNGVVLLLRTEMKSEFAKIDQRFAQIDEQLVQVNRSIKDIHGTLDFIAREVSTLVGRKGG